jgi:hypothetical protein
MPVKPIPNGRTHRSPKLGRDVDATSGGPLHDIPTRSLARPGSAGDGHGTRQDSERPAASTSSTRASASASVVRGFMKPGRIAKRAPTRVVEGTHLPRARTRRTISAFNVASWCKTSQNVTLAAPFDAQIWL